MATVTVNGIELFYEASGPDDAPVIVFAHSIGTDHSIFDAQVAALGDRYRTIRYDLRGHGRSAAFDRAVTIADLAADQAALLDAFGVAKAHVAGLSIGGMVAQAFAARSPERVRSLALMATSAHLPPAQFWHDRAALVRTSGIGAAADLVLPRWFTEPYRARHPEVIAGFRRRFNQTDPQGYARCCEAIAAWDHRERIGATKAPALIIVGSEDPATPPAMAEELRQHIPGAEMVVISGASHIISVERADAVTAYLAAFLDRQPRTD